MEEPSLIAACFALVLPVPSPVDVIGRSSDQPVTPMSDSHVALSYSLIEINRIDDLTADLVANVNDLGLAEMVSFKQRINTSDGLAFLTLEDNDWLNRLISIVRTTSRSSRTRINLSFRSDQPRPTELPPKLANGFVMLNDRPADMTTYIRFLQVENTRQPRMYLGLSEDQSVVHRSIPMVSFQPLELVIVQVASDGFTLGRVCRAIPLMQALIV